MGRGKLANQGRRQESGCLTMEAVLERAAECSRDDGGQGRLGEGDGSRMTHPDAINTPAG